LDLRFREAEQKDVLTLVGLLADDELGQQREDTSLPMNDSYLLAFDQIADDPNNELFVVEVNQIIAGMLQLTFIPYLTHIGSWRCLIEGVRIHRDYRNQGLGTEFINWAINRAQIRNCSIVQLTTDKQRPKAIRFYENLRFEPTHEGFKLKLNQKELGKS
jgi:GNAT superfamily N-acetyltransferase